MADTLNINFISPSPAPGAAVGETIQVWGNVAASAGLLVVNKNSPSLSVQFGAGGSLVKAIFSGLQWNCVGTVSPSAANGAPIQITASGSAAYIPPGLPSTETTDIEGSGTLSVTLSVPPPALTAALQPSSLDVTATTLPYAVTVSGTATAATSLTSISLVQYTLDGSALANVDNPSGNWSTWSKALALPAGTHTLKVQATDTRGNTTVFPAFTIRVQIPIPPTDADQAFAPTTYLRDLLDLAQRRVTTPGNLPGCTAALLTTAYAQPFDRLTAAEYYQQAIQPTHQARVAIEILRQILSPAPGVPADLDQQYRLLAYRAILRGVGTSYDELRLARVAPPATRQALAARIGIEIGGTRPDNLDHMLLLSTDLTDAALDTIFGYRSTAPADPLAAHADGSSFSSWQTSALSGIWQRADAQTRDSAAGALPVIDPDVIGSGNTISQTPAFTLWTARNTWINTTLNQITTEASTVSVPLTRFDQLVLHYIGAVDITGLAASDANGSDIGAALAPLFLDLDAFRFLALCSQLLSTAAATSPAILLPSEWDDIYAILLETQKRQQYRQWRLEETQQGIVLAPDQFQPDSDTPAAPLLAWRGSPDTFSQWRRTLIGRASQLQTVVNGYLGVVDAAEAQTLPALRDALLQILATEVSQSIDFVARNLSNTFLFDFRLNAGPKTTRAELAIETLQNILSSVRSGQLSNAASNWRLDPPPDPTSSTFDEEWVWLSTFQTWGAAIRVFAYPENQLAPTLYVPDGSLQPTSSYQTFIANLRAAPRMNPDSARIAAGAYLTSVLGAEAAGHLPAGFSLTERLSDAALIALGQLTVPFPVVPSDYPPYLFEIFYLVPVAIGLRLQSDREYVAALDWFRTVYAFHLPPADRKIFHGLFIEGTITTAYTRLPDWLATELNPHIIVQATTSGTTVDGRKNAYTRFTVLSILQCLLAYADQRFSVGTAESTAQARTLYETVVNLLSIPELQPEDGAPFPANPIWQPLLLHAQSDLTKIHNGLNIAGVLLPASSDSATVFLQSQYPYSVLVNRAKNLVGLAQQVESSYLTALEQRDAATYSVLQANNDMQVAKASLTLAQLKVNDAADGVTAAQLQQNKANVEYNYYDQLISNGLNSWEEAGLGAMAAAGVFKGAKATFDVLDDIASGTSGLFKVLGGVFGGAADVSSSVAQFSDTEASYDRREKDWEYQRNLANQDIQIAGQQIVVAQDQDAIAGQEQIVAGVQFINATGVLNFLSNKFTNAELFDWMSGVLGGSTPIFCNNRRLSRSSPKHNWPSSARLLHRDIFVQTIGRTRPTSLTARIGRV